MSLQKFIDVCCEFASANDMIFNFKKSVCMYVRSKKFKDLNQPTFYLNGNILRYVDHEKYLGVMISNDGKNDKDINRQMRSIYGRGNMIVRNFKHCTDTVKIQLFKTFCCNFYCCHLWSKFNKSAYYKAKIAFKKIYRSLMGLDRRASITEHMILRNIDSFDAIIRKDVYGFRERIFKSDNSVIYSIFNSLCFLDSSLHTRWMCVLF